MAVEHADGEAVTRTRATRGGATARPADPDPDALLEAIRLSKSYVQRGRVVEALKDVSLRIGEHSFVTIVGRSGCGKSTLVRLLAGLLSPSAGRVLLSGAEVNSAPAEARCVFQDYGQSLLPWKTTIENVAFGVRHGIERLAGETARVEALAALELVGLGHVARRYPWELSGGMQQRVAIARALASRPRLLLMDEPFSSVDALSRANLQDKLLEVWGKLRNTIVFVTHDIDEAVYLSDRVIVLDEGGAGVLADVPIDLPRPRSQLVTREEPSYLHARREILRLVLG